ncbi:coiled-coil domain-containing protein 17 isoform X2 [Myxocyprinus asiaticus]|uniref:coiled-coil domain-containing protein 17 isoform X2 n=1 Tax=Myxocyprinus asiaticus TaxID=70543 RepID=UPI00222265CA|nr:coiled-coil domain-containing protein 17 isoform X2 [Myxocyprinus asiaticus]
MEGLGEFICQDCNMAFHSTGLLDKHKAKFCIGIDLKDPVTLRKGWLGLTETKKTAVRTVHPTRVRTPDFFVLKEQSQQMVQRKSEQDKPHNTLPENTTLSKLTEEKLRMSVENSLPRRQTMVSEEQGLLQQRADEQRGLELLKHHEQKLADIRAHNHQLEKQREEIKQRLAELAGRDRTVHLEEVLQEMRYHEQRNEDVLHQLSTHINSIKEFNPNEVPSNPPEDKKTQHLTFDKISSVNGPLSAQIRSLHLAYMQSGGSDPEVLAHMHDLQAEALTLEQAKPRADRKTKERRMKSPKRVQDPEILAVEQENQRLEEEIFRIQLARERHIGEHGLHDIQKDHIHHMASLQAEITFLRREIEKGRDKRLPPPLPLFPGTSLALTHPALALDQISKQGLGCHVTDPMETLGPAPYDSVAGFVIFYDLVMGIEATLRSVRLMAGFYCNGQKLGQTTYMPPVQCQPAGALHYPSTKTPENYAILAVKQPVPRIQPSPYLSLIVEIQASGCLDAYNHEFEGLVSCGWAKLELFDQHSQVQRGHWRVPFRSLPVRASLSPSQVNSVPQLGNMELCLRLVNSHDGDVQTLAKIDPNHISQYKYPPVVCKGTCLKMSFVSLTAYLIVLCLEPHKCLFQVVSNTPTIVGTHEPFYSTLQPSSKPLPSLLPQSDHVDPTRQESN